MCFLMKIFKDVCQNLNLNQDSRLEVGTFFSRQSQIVKVLGFVGHMVFDMSILNSDVARKLPRAVNK